MCAASLTPAKFLGLEHERGNLIPGARADFVALTQELEVIATWIDGSADDVKVIAAVNPLPILGLGSTGIVAAGWPGLLVRLRQQIQVQRFCT